MSVHGALVPIVAPLIERVPGRYGGAAVLAGTRLTVMAIEAYRVHALEHGRDEVETVRAAYPYLTDEQIRAAFDYADGHRVELREDRDAACEVGDARAKARDEWEALPAEARAPVLSALALFVGHQHSEAFDVARRLLAVEDT